MHYLELTRFLTLRSPLIDVRSESEFAQGHIPGAVSIPLLNNEEREKVGIAYARDGQEPAVNLGYELAGSRFPEMISKAAAASKGGNMRLYCWRGGMRSSIMAGLLEKAGMQTILLQGGYKSFRRWALPLIEMPRNLHVLCGMTGTGKTVVLHELAMKGAQVLDLEKLANHKGSVYGGIGTGHQPTNEQFENELAMELMQSDRSLPLWVEDESRFIGRIKIPDALFARMQQSPATEVVIPDDERVNNILKEYSRLPREELIAATLHLRKRLGSERMNLAVASLEKGNQEEWVRHVLPYYDKCYRFSMEQRPRELVRRIIFESADVRLMANEVLKSQKSITWKPQPAGLD